MEPGNKELVALLQECQVELNREEARRLELVKSEERKVATFRMAWELFQYFGIQVSTPIPNAWCPPAQLDHYMPHTESVDAIMDAMKTKSSKFLYPN